MMASTSNDSEAVNLLKRAITLDHEAKYSESIKCYEQGISLLMLVAKGKSKTFSALCTQ